VKIEYSEPPAHITEGLIYIRALIERRANDLLRMGYRGNPHHKAFVEYESQLKIYEKALSDWHMVQIPKITISTEDAKAAGLLP
jgi:hypothetical protein